MKVWRNISLWYRFKTCHSDNKEWFVPCSVFDVQFFSQDKTLFIILILDWCIIDHPLVEILISMATLNLSLVSIFLFFSATNKGSSEACHWGVKIMENYWFFQGPMFAGKSTELLRRCRRYEKAHPQEQKPLIIKYCKDNRYDENLFSTHDGKVKNNIF